MKKMFLKKLICLLLSLIFSISPVLSNFVAFSAEVDWDFVDRQGEEALEVSMTAVRDDSSQYESNAEHLSAYEANVFCFKSFWNYLVKKYIFYKCGFEDSSFESSGVYLTEGAEINDNLVQTLYSLTEKLLSHERLCDEEDLEIINRANLFTKDILMRAGIFSSTNIFPRNFSGKTWNTFINLSVARSIYREILKICPYEEQTDPLPYFIDAATTTILLDNGNIVNFEKTPIELNFEILWNSVMGCFIFDKISGFRNYHSLLNLSHLNIFYVRLLHEFAIKLRACNRLYPIEYLPFLNAAIDLTEQLANDHAFDLPDNLIGRLSNTNWLDNKTRVEKIFDFIKKLESLASPTKRSR